MIILFLHDITVSDDAIAAYVKEHPKQYTNKEEVRNLVYTEYNVVASAQDSAKYFADMTALASEFKNSLTTPCLQPQIMVYIQVLSVIKRYNWRTKGTSYLQQQ